MAKREERSIISFIGRTNSGKSSLLNLLTHQKDFAIVDKTPGTTADTVVTLMEIHDLGPFKIFDTAGVDEFSELGEKKRKKTYEALEEADLNFLVINFDHDKKKDLEIEKNLIRHVRAHGKQILAVYNQFDSKKNTKSLKKKWDDALGVPSIVLSANNITHRKKLVKFIQQNFIRESRDIDLLPCVKGKGFVLLVIPMDEETPTLRLLRPQDMAVERLLRNFAIPVLFRMDLGKARNINKKIVQKEKKRYTDLLQHLETSSEGLQLVITDSQAFNIVAHWTQKKYPLTSFSVMMANFMSYGKLKSLKKGAEMTDSLKQGDTILVVESCNHNRKCDDIGTVQIPNRLQKYTKKKLKFEFSFGRTFPENLKKYGLIIHCGGCMGDRQKFARRMLLAKMKGIAFTNYGFCLSYLEGKKFLERVLKPFQNEKVKI